jgi:hypothetical protein
MVVGLMVMVRRKIIEELELVTVRAGAVEAEEVVVKAVAVVMAEVVKTRGDK